MDLLEVSFYRNMMQDISIEKDENIELPVPTEWRATLKAVADAFVSGQVPSGAGIKAIDIEAFEINKANIADYPDVLGPLNDAAWQTSVYIWMQDFWEVLVDLSTHNGKTCDLVLHARVYSTGGSFNFEPGLIYVP